MSEAVKKGNLVEHFSRYIDHMKGGSKKGASFTEKLTQQAESAPREISREDEKGRGGNSRLSESRAGRRHQPPRLARAKAITNLQAQRLARYAPAIEFFAKKHNVPVELICGVILQESGGNAKALSHCGAQGLMQLMPGTAKRFGVTNAFDPIQNIEGGTKYLRFLLDKFDGKLDLALAGYNAGEHNVEKYGNKIPPFAETQGYVPNVLGYTQTMIDIFASRMNGGLPSSARRV